MLTFTRDHTLPAAYSLLPSEMESDAASVMLLAIAKQESDVAHRHQRVRTRAGTWIHGAANGLWQFERGGGVRGVLNHSATKNRAESVCHTLLYEPKPRVVHKAIAHNDVLACVFARLLLWTHPAPIPRDHRAAWQYYLELWRPGRPHERTWAWCFREAEHAINATKGD